MGLSISFTGILTFKKSQALRDLAAELPADRIMVETDAPYLAPGKFRGKRNEPSYVVETAKVLAETRGVSLEEISRQTTENFFRLFSKVPRCDPQRKSRHDADADHSRLRILRRRAAPGARLGRLRSRPIRKTAAAAARCWSSGRRAQGTTRIVIDTSPDLREQLIDANVDHIDAVFLTHEHADQTHGIDDLRSVVLHQRRRIPVYLNQSTAEHILLRFSYCFVSPPGSDYPPILDHAFDRRPAKAGPSKARAAR